MPEPVVPSMKYAVVERERRFLPIRRPDLSTARRVLEIEDRYLTGTRLRLRTTRDRHGTVVRKLGQKIRFDPADGSALAHTTLYLDEIEYAALAPLPASTLRKTRYVLPLVDGLDVPVDVFHDDLDGLVLAEVDLGADGTLPDPPPEWLGTEVTGLERFSGHALARTTADELGRLLRDVS